MPYSETTILYVQIAASILMGWDYFVKKEIRDVIDNFLSKRFSAINTNIVNDTSKDIEYMPKNICFVVVGLLMIFIPILFRRNIFDDSLFLIVQIILSTIGLVILLNNFIQLIFPVGFSFIFRIVINVIIKSDKGQISVLGFFCLLVSFYMRYKNYSFLAK